MHIDADPERGGATVTFDDGGGACGSMSDWVPGASAGARSTVDGAPLVLKVGKTARAGSACAARGADLTAHGPHAHAIAELAGLMPEKAAA